VTRTHTHRKEASRKTQCATGWPRPIGCLSGQVVFRGRATNYIHFQVIFRGRATNYIHFQVIFRGRATNYIHFQVIFSGRATNYRAFVRKMTCKNKASYGSWPPCIYCVSQDAVWSIQSIAHCLLRDAVLYMHCLYIAAHCVLRDAVLYMHCLYIAAHCVLRDAVGY